jgi:hypothetical protein
MKPRVAYTDFAALRLPGEAYHAALKLIAAGELEQARELKKYMLPSDAGLIEKRIARNA